MELTKGKIGILVIALGRYTEFWPELYTSCEKYFLPNYQKEYYIFKRISGNFKCNAFQCGRLIFPVPERSGSGTLSII